MDFKKYLLAGGLASVLVLGACGNDEDTETETDVDQDTETTEETETSEETETAEDPAMEEGAEVD